MSEASGPLFQSMVRELRTMEFDRRKVLESRSAVLLVSGAVAAVLMVGFAKNGHDAALLKALPWLLLSASIALGVRTYGFAYSVIDVESLNKVVTDEIWTLPLDYALRCDVHQKVETISTVRRGNNRMAVWNLVGLAFWLVAASTFAVSVAFEVL